MLHSLVLGLLVLVRLVQEVPALWYVSINAAIGSVESEEGCALDEALLVGAGGVDRGSLDGSRGLAATTDSGVGTTEQSSQDAHGELYEDMCQSIDRLLGWIGGECRSRGAAERRFSGDVTDVVRADLATEDVVCLDHLGGLGVVLERSGSEGGVAISFG